MPLYDYNFFEYFNALERKIKATPINLGGIIASGGGIGGPPGGYIGMLPQTRVAYDLSEASIQGFVSENPYDPSGVLISASLLDNMNHIRYRITALEPGGGNAGVHVYNNDVLVASGIYILDFKGDFANAEDVGGNQVEITISGKKEFIDLDDTPNTLSGHANKYVTIKNDESGLEFTTLSGGAGTSTSTSIVYDTAYASAADSHTSTANWEDINSMSTTIDMPTSGWIEAIFTCTIATTSADWEHFLLRFDLDGTTQSETYRQSEDINIGNNPYYMATIHTAFETVASGSHTVKAQWQDNSSNLDVTFYQRRLTILGIYDDELNTDLIDTYKAKVSSNDTTEGFLEDKIVAGSNIIVTTLNEGANEDVQIAASGLSLSGHTHTESDITDLSHDADLLKGVNISGISPNEDDVLTYDGTNWTPTTLPAGADAFRVIGFYQQVTSGWQTGTALPVRMLAPWDGTIYNVVASVATAPVASAVIVDIHKNGTTVFTTQANRPSISVGTLDDLTSTPDVTSFSKNDVFTCYIDQTPSTGGDGLLVQIRVNLV